VFDDLVGDPHYSPPDVGWRHHGDIAHQKTSCPAIRMEAARMDSGAPSAMT
jgi:hypothetical protein